MTSMSISESPIALPIAPVRRILPTADLNRELDYLTDLEVLRRVYGMEAFCQRHQWDFRRVFRDGYDNTLRQCRDAYYEAEKEFKKTWETYRRARWAYVELNILLKPHDVYTPKSFSIGYDNFIEVAASGTRLRIYWSSHRLLTDSDAISHEWPFSTFGGWSDHEKKNKPYLYQTTNIGKWLLAHPRDIERFLMDHDHPHVAVNRFWNLQSDTFGE